MVDDTKIEENFSIDILDLFDKPDIIQTIKEYYPNLEDAEKVFRKLSEMGNKFISPSSPFLDELDPDNLGDSAHEKAEMIGSKYNFTDLEKRGLAAFQAVFEKFLTSANNFTKDSIQPKNESPPLQIRPLL